VQGGWYIKTYSNTLQSIIICTKYISIVKPSRCTIFLVYWISLYMFRKVFPSMIMNSRLYIQHQVDVIQVSWLHASGHEMEQFHLVPASMESTKLYNIYLMLYVGSWIPDDGRKDRPKHVEWYSINFKNCASSWFYYKNISRCTVPWTLNLYEICYYIIYYTMRKYTNQPALGI